MNPIYSIVIPTFNKCQELLMPCLQSIITYTDLSDIEILIVANGCTDETKEYVTGLSLVHSQIKLIWMDEASGYAKPTNEGIKKSIGDYIILLNNDTVLLPQKKNEWIEKLVKPFLEDDKIGITGPMKTFSLSAGRDFIIFFCVMISRKVIDTIGILDESFYSYGEDTSYCCDAENAGFKIKQVPCDSNEYYEDKRMKGDFPIYHIGNVSHANFPDGEKLIERNNEKLMKKYNMKVDEKKNEDISYKKCQEIRCVIPTITVGIPTKNRYSELSHTLLSIAFQTLRPHEIIIVDDSDNPVDVRNIPQYAYILRLFDDYGIKWKYLFGKKKGPHYSHELIQEIAEGDLIFRCDDDCVAEPDVLEKLSKQMIDGIGAVAPLVLMPNAQLLPSNAENKIDNIHAPNIQWFKWDGIREVDHLYSCFLYRKGIEKYELSLSHVAFREESIFSHKIKRAGYKLLVDSSATIWHFRSETGGIRSSHNDKNFYDDDDKIFQGLLNLWNVKSAYRKIIVLDAGIGDHYSFKNILPQLKKKYDKLTLAVCYPDVFFDDEGIELISISDAINILGDIKEFNIYRKMDQWNWNKSITEAFEKLYL